MVVIVVVFFSNRVKGEFYTVQYYFCIIFFFGLIILCAIIIAHRVCASCKVCAVICAKKNIPRAENVLSVCVKPSD